jgi:hypothetical protein
MLLLNKIFQKKEAKNKMLGEKNANTVAVIVPAIPSPSLSRKRLNSIDLCSLPSAKKVCL